MESLTALESSVVEQSHYASHLAEVNKSQAVVSTEDVYSTNGLMLVKKGVRITPPVAEKIVRHKLPQADRGTDQPRTIPGRGGAAPGARRAVRPLSRHRPDAGGAQFRSEAQEPGAGIEARRDPVTEFHRPQEPLAGGLREIDFLRLVVRAHRPPHGPGRQGDPMHVHRRPLSRRRLLHIDPNVLHKHGRLTPDEWRAIQSHVVAGHLIIKRLSSSHDAARAVLEHHEYRDGRGAVDDPGGGAHRKTRPRPAGAWRA